MELKLFKKIDLAVAWLVFALSAITYLMTISHSASLWDCAEFIICVHKLEVGHPPGSPFFMLVYNVASQLASTPAGVATLCNATSGVLSAFTIFFLYLTITHMLRRLYAGGEPAAIEGTKLPRHRAIATLLAGFGGAMLYAFTDTFWFSAVEAEVYAFSSFFTALVFWLMLQWEERADNVRSDRWIVLIAFFIGLGIGVHLLNLLCIPAMALIFYFRKSAAPKLRGSLLALLLSAVLIVLIMYGVMQGSMKVATFFDVFTVNTLHWPFNSGLVLYLLLLALAFGWSFWEMHRHGLSTRARIATVLTTLLSGVPFIGQGWLIPLLVIGAMLYLLFGHKALNLRVLYTIQSSLVAILVGFSCYGVILVRSAAQPPMNENDPSTAVELRKYLAREQYGSTPRLYGPSFTATPIAMTEKKGDWRPAPKRNASDKDRYVRGSNKRKIKYSHEMLFPRLYSSQQSHIYGYNLWMNRDLNDLSEPSFADNLRYFFSYQVNYMYWRYFGWNFIGRQNDLQGNGGMLAGGVATGFNAIDKLFWGDKAFYPSEMENKGHNVYYLLPLLLGILGIVLQLTKKERGAQSFLVTFMIFFMTGIAIILYINQTPGQPRERDYAYAASFYAFAIWIGFGIMAIWERIAHVKKGALPALAAALVIAVGVPLQMLCQNYDDHDRSGRTVAADLGRNYLESCAPNALLFCYGDNDTFPLWYAQEIEGIRTDVRAANLSYLASHWYIDQMRREAYQSAPIALESLTPDFYYPTEFVYVAEEGAPMPVATALQQLKEQQTYNGHYMLPSNNLFLPLDTLQLQRKYPDLHFTDDKLHISLKGKSLLTRDGLFLLDFLQQNQWKRPIYWAKTTPTDAFSNLREYLSSQGADWMLNPTVMKGVLSPQQVMNEYDIVMNKFRWFGANKEGIYFDENIRNNIISVFRAQVFPHLALSLLGIERQDLARKVLERCFQELPAKNTPYQYSDLSLAEACYKAAMNEQGDTIAKALLAKYNKKIDWVIMLPDRLRGRALKEGEVYSLSKQVADLVASLYTHSRYKTFEKEITQLVEKLRHFDPNWGQQP